MNIAIETEYGTNKIPYVTLFKSVQLLYTESLCLSYAYTVLGKKQQ